MKKTIAVLFVCVLGLINPLSQEASAQAWSTEESGARQREIVRRYRSLLERRPVEGVIFDRLVEEVGSGRGFDALVALYEGLVEDDSQSFAYRMILGHLYKRSGALAEAIEQYEAAAALNAESPWPWQSMGDALLGVGLASDATVAYERALESTRNSEERRRILFALADIAFAANQLEQAVAYLERIVQDNPNDVYMRMQLADVLVEHEEYEAALIQYQAIVDLSSRDTRRKAVTLGMAGDTLLLLSRVDEAIETYRQAQRYASGGSWLWMDLEQRIVDAYRASGDVAALIDTYEREWRRPSYDQLRILAGLYLEVGRVQDAEATLRRAIAQNRRSIDARLELVQLLEQNGELTGAVREYREILRLSDEVIHRIQMVNLLDRTGESEDALDVLRRAERDYRTRPGALGQIADAYIRRGALERAAEVYSQIISLEPDYYDHYLMLGEIYFMDGLWEEALSSWRRVSDVVEDPAEAAVILARVYADHRMVDDAITTLRDAGAESTNDPRLVQALAQILEDARRYTAALREWSRLTQLGDSEAAIEGRQHIIAIYAEQGVLGERIAPLRREWADGEGGYDAGLFLADALMATGQHEEAEVVFTALLELQPENVPLLWLLAELYEAENALADAIAVYQLVGNLEPADTGLAYMKIIELALTILDEDLATETARALVRHAPRDPRSFAALGRVYRQNLRFALSASAYEEAVRLDRLAHRYVFDLAEVYISLRQPNAALDVYADAIARTRDRSTLMRAGRLGIQLSAQLGEYHGLLAILDGQRNRPDFESECREVGLLLMRRVASPLLRQARSAEGEPSETAQEALTELGRDGARILRASYGDSDVRVRSLALELAPDVNRTADVETIAGALSGPEPATRIRAALALGRLVSGDVTEQLTAALLDESADVRGLAAAALGAPSGAEAPRALEGLVGGENDERVKAIALISLGLLGGEGSQFYWQSTTEALLEGPPGLAVAAALSMGIGRSSDATPVLLEALEREEARVLEAALWALGAGPVSSEVVDGLLKSFWLSNSSARFAAGLSLRAIDSGVANGARDAAWYQETSVWSGGQLSVERWVAHLAGTELWPLTEGRERLIDRFRPQLEAVIGAVLTSGTTDQKLWLLTDMTGSPGQFGLGVVSHGTSDGGDLHSELAEVLGAQVDALGELLEQPQLRDRSLLVLLTLAAEGNERAEDLVAGNAPRNALVGDALALRAADELAFAEELLGSSSFWSIRGLAAHMLMRAGWTGSPGVSDGAEGDLFRAEGGSELSPSETADGDDTTPLVRRTRLLQ